MAAFATMQTRLKIAMIVREVVAVDCEVRAICHITISRTNALLLADKPGSFRTLIPSNPIHQKKNAFFLR
jgi:hypothetical protein